MQELDQALKLADTLVGSVVIILVPPLLALLVVLVATMFGLSKEIGHAAHPLQ